MSDFERIYLEPEHNQIEGRMSYQDDVIRELSEYTLQQNDRIAALTADRNEWVKKANAATALASQYLRERDRYREALEVMVSLYAGQIQNDGGYDVALDIARDALNREE